jgi:hypothetical protein
MASPTAFYEVEDERGGLLTVGSTSHTAGPWSPVAQHGGPPMALLARAVERLADGERAVARLTCDLLGPVPVSRLAVGARVVRPGRTVELVEATLDDVGTGRTVARASAWLAPRVDGPSGDAPAPPPGPDAGHDVDMPPGWQPGYLDAIEWRWVEGALGVPGPAMVWMRPRVSLLAGESLSPLQRLMVCVDSASGASAVLDIRDWEFMNTELTAHLVREPRGEWVGLRARTFLGGTATGIATAEVFDTEGFVARSAQALLVRPSSLPTD